MVAEPFFGEQVTSNILQRFAGQLNHNILCMLALAQEVSSEVRHALTIRISQ